MTTQALPTGSVDNEIWGDLAALGARYDAAPVFPASSLRRLAEGGLHRRFAPAAAGGSAWDDTAALHHALYDTLRRVGRADLSLGRLYEGHVNAMLLFAWYARPDQMRWLSSLLDRGAWFGVWATEPTPGVRIDEDGLLDGAKIFASGAGGLAFALVTASPAAGDRRLVIVPADEATRADLSGWRVRGMRASGSGRYDLTGLPADDMTLLGEAGNYDIEPRFTTGAWRFCAVQLGGIEALLTETRVAMSDTAKGDPMQRARFADAVAATRTAGFWVAEAAARAAAGQDDAIAIVRMARGVVERAGFDVMEAAARIVGTKSAFDGERIDKIMRDLSLYLRQGGPDYARDQAAGAFLDHDCWSEDDRLW